MTIIEEHEGSTERDRYCAECGYQLSGSRYCPGCGHQVGAPSDVLDAPTIEQPHLREHSATGVADIPAALPPGAGSRPLLRRARAPRRANPLRERATCGSVSPAFLSWS